MKRSLGRWLAPGLGFKRWIVLGLAGLLSVALGIFIFLQTPPKQISGMAWATSLNFWIAFLFVVLGIVTVSWSWTQWLAVLTRAVDTSQHQRLVDVLYQKQKLSRGHKIVTMGGGTGMSSLLRALKKISGNLTAVVTVADDGGSSGRLSKELGILPPGDIRNCLVALADDESLLSQLFTYRFTDGEGLEGHAFGNIFLAALNNIVGDFEKAVERSSKILNIQGRVLPATLTPITLCAHYQDGSQQKGESEIPQPDKKIKQVYLEPSDVATPSSVLNSLEQADLIILGPGSLYTSILPNLLVPQIQDFLLSTQTPILYICNVMTQPGETDGYKASDHIRVLHEHLKQPFINYCLINLDLPNKALLKKYQAQGSIPVEGDIEAIRNLGVEPVSAHLLSQKNLLRHNVQALRQAVAEVITQNGNPKTRFLNR